MIEPSSEAFTVVVTSAIVGVDRASSMNPDRTENSVLVLYIEIINGCLSRVEISKGLLERALVTGAVTK